MTGQAGNNGQDRDGGVDGERRDARVARDARVTPSGQQRDLADDLQRWLVRSGVRSMRRELSDQVRRAFHTQRPAEPSDVWGTATTESPPELLAASAEAPECAWCPVCRAARRIRESAPSVGGQLVGASDVVAAAVQEAMRAFEAAMSMGQRGDRAPGFPADAYPADRFPTDRFPVAGAPGEGADHEPDNRD